MLDVQGKFSCSYLTPICNERLNLRRLAHAHIKHQCRILVVYVLQIVYTTGKGYDFIDSLQSKMKLLRLNFHVGKKNFIITKIMGRLVTQYCSLANCKYLFKKKKTMT